MSKQKLPIIPPQKPPAQLPAPTNGQLPAVAKATHPVRALKNFAAEADDLAEHYGELQKARQNIRSVSQTPQLANAQKYLDEASALLRRHDKNFRGVAKELELALNEQFSPDDAYDDDYRLLEARVRAAIALLLASFPNANPGNSEAYVGMMVEEVMAEDDVSLVVLESACSQIRRTSKFPPTTAEVIEAIREQAEFWQPRLNAIHSCANLVGWIRLELPAAQDELTAAKAEREERARIAAEKKRADEQLRAQPLKVGDRVQNKRAYHMGPGTIADVCGGGFYICYDSMGTCVSGGKHLQRLISGDPGFEIVEAKRAAIEKRLAEYRVLLQRRPRPVVGDRVTDDIDERHPLDDPPNGAGTVVFAADFDDDYDDGFTVQFDNGKLVGGYRACHLRRLLPGDAEFERSEKVVAGWRAWELKHGVFVSHAGGKSAATTDGCDTPPDSASCAATSESAPMFAIGDRVAHRSFGPGTVVEAAGSTVGGLGVRFDKCGYMRVAKSFLERAE
jgi:hypothetical protein